MTQNLGVLVLCILFCICMDSVCSILCLLLHQCSVPIYNNTTAIHVSSVLVSGSMIEWSKKNVVVSKDPS
jgi:hypothetical protein